MDFAAEPQQLLFDGFTDAVQGLERIGQWCLAQIFAVPWDRAAELPASKVLVLVAAAGFSVYFILPAGRELYEAGKQAFLAFVAFLKVCVRRLPRILAACLAAAAGAWIVNHVKL